MEKQEAPRYVRNAIRTPDGTVIYSRHRHDFQSHVDANGNEYIVDGGLDYLRRSFHKDAPHEELAVELSQPFEVVREAFEWGTYGKEGKGPLHYVKLSELGNNHVESITEHIKYGVKVEKSRFSMESLNMRNDMRKAAGLADEEGDFIVMEHPSQWLLPLLEKELQYRQTHAILILETPTPPAPPFKEEAS